MHDTTAQDKTYFSEMPCRGSYPGDRCGCRSNKRVAVALSFFIRFKIWPIPDHYQVSSFADHINWSVRAKSICFLKNPSDARCRTTKSQSQLLVRGHSRLALAVFKDAGCALKALSCRALIQNDKPPFGSGAHKYSQIFVLCCSWIRHTSENRNANLQLRKKRMTIEKRDGHSN